MHYMLLAPLDDAKQSMLLFPAWPTEWDVRFKLHAPLNTVVEAACINGSLAKLVVDPPERRAALPNRARGSQTRADAEAHSNAAACVPQRALPSSRR